VLEVEVFKEISEVSLEVKFSVSEHDFVAISGKSGSGKTTLLRIIAGLEDAKGVIRAFGKDWLNKDVFVKPQKRGIGFVFQDYALFENMSVEQNLLYVDNDKKLANHLLEITQMIDYKSRHPRSLSGGQKQRVALCRALMSRPKLLLLDEPFSALDLAMRKKLHQDIENFRSEFGTTTIMVSHDINEIYRLASRVIILDNGKITQEGNPKELLFKDLEQMRKELADTL